MWIAIQNAVGARQGVGGGPGPTPPYTPPLDAYPADIAYSVRKLSSSYSGPCMEVERGVDAATLDIGFDTNGLLDTQAIIDFATTGGGSGEIRIRTWYDQTGNSRHAQTSVAADMSYIYSGSAIYQANGKPVVDPRGTNDGLYPILGTYSTAANNTIFTVISPGQTGGSYVMTRPIGSGGSGILAAGIEEPIGGWNANIDYGFGTTQYYRDGAFYGNSTLQRNDIMQSVLASRRIFDIGFTQSGLNSLNFGRNGSSSIYATQEYIVYFSDQLGTVPRTALEGNINSYYQVANLPDYTSGFLADYPDAAAAYSVRKLSNTAIKALRVRRTVAPFDEQDIGFTAGGDLDEAAISTFGASDTLVVSRWYDQSGFSRHAVQIIPGSQPQIYNGTAVLTENGKPFLKFRGGNSGNESMTMESEVACETTFSVVANDTPGFLAYYLWSSGALGFFSGGTISGYTGPGVAIGATAGYIVGTETGQTLLYNDHNGTGWEVGQDGGAATQVVATGAKGIDQIVRPSTNLQVEKFQEVIIYDSDKSTYRTAIEENINDYYKITINPDAATSGFLFDYPNATTAYSVRQLNNNAEYCMQVERSDGERLYVGFVAGELDTQAIIDFAGASVATLKVWYDQSGAQNHATLFDLNDPPQIYDGSSIISLNGNPAIYAPAAGTRMTVPSQTLTDASVLCVYELSTDNHAINNEAAPRYRLRFFSGRMYLYLDGVTISGSLASAGDHQLHTFYDDGATIYWRTNGGDEYTRAFTGSTKHERIIGNLSSGMKFQEYILFDTNKYSDRTGIETDTMTYYGIP